MTEIIHKERFKVWLFSQADSRKFDYCDIHECIGCAFVKETTQIEAPRFGNDYWRRQRGARTTPLPAFFISLLNEVLDEPPQQHEVITIADTKRAWLKLFPETEVNIQPAQAVKEAK